MFLSVIDWFDEYVGTLGDGIAVGSMVADVIEVYAASFEFQWEDGSATGSTSSSGQMQFSLSARVRLMKYTSPPVAGKSVSQSVGVGKLINQRISFDDVSVCFSY